jgi:hypothetical protein
MCHQSSRQACAQLQEAVGDTVIVIVAFINNSSSEKQSVKLSVSRKIIAQQHYTKALAADVIAAVKRSAGHIYVYGMYSI